MSRYLGSRLRLIRKLGNLPNLTFKKSRRFSLPNVQSSLELKKISEFGIRLKEKQKIKFSYGITDRQILNYLIKAKKKKSSTGIEFLNFLEMRLDTILLRSGFFPTIFFARQFISHGHILVNDNIVSIPSFFCKPSDIVKVNNFILLHNIVKKNLLLVKSSYFTSVDYLLIDSDSLFIKVINFVSKKSAIFIINELLVIEFYSKKL